MLTTCIYALMATAVTLASPMFIKRDVDPALVPPFGITPDTNPDGNGNCDGVVVNGKPVLIPCSCPPDETSFLQSLNANVAAGHAVNNPSVPVTFPTDDSTNSQIARIQSVLVSLQNLRGPGVGCPASSTNLLAKLKALQSGDSAPAPASSTSVPAPAASSLASESSSIASLAPPLGFQSGVNPTGTGDCDGAVKDANGQAIKVPCSCPPSQDEYISQLTANAAAGHAINNPSVSLSFPTDNSAASQRERIIAALITIQNLNGPGVGCPAASTTLSAQLAAVQG